jgi:peroxiredoxin family protein
MDKGPDLEAMIERIVEARVNERFAGLEQRVDEALASLQEIQGRTQSDHATLLVFSGEFDKLMSAFIVATGAIAMGLEVSMYFTFWGLTALRKNTRYKGKGVAEKMIATMLPSGPESAPTSQMNMGGIGPKFFQQQMNSKNVESLPGLIELAKDMGVKLIACQMAMDVMGIEEDELIDDIEYGGVATYLGEAIDAKVTLFI